SDDEKKLDVDFTPTGLRNWTDKRYHRKLSKLARTISAIGFSDTRKSPAFLGIAEVENKKVIRDLLNTDPLNNIDYGFIHYDSPDERGIDTAFLFRRDVFIVIHSEPITLLVDNLNGER